MLFCLSSFRLAMQTERQDTRYTSSYSLDKTSKKQKCVCNPPPRRDYLHTHHEHGVEVGAEWRMHDGDLKTAHMPFIPFFCF